MYAEVCAWHEHGLPHSTNELSLPRKIFIVDDHPLMRKGYKALVQLEPDLSICAEAEGGYEALEKLYSIKVDLVITDVSMDDLNGFELTRRIKDVWPELPVLVVSSHDRRTHGLRARKVGACGYIEKNALTEDGLNVIRCALTQRTCNCCPHLFDD